jgi:CubicO group peptidase (beta-lactamase class C family)
MSTHTRSLPRRLARIFATVSAQALLLAVPLTAQAQGTLATTGMDPARLARIDRVMQAAVDSGTIAGAVTLVLRHGRVAHQGAYGMADREAGRRMTLDALFRIASQSKAITSTAVMILVEEGAIRLHDPVSKWIPGFASTKVASASDTGLVLTRLARPITIRDLLTQTAGISYGYDSLIRPLYVAAGLGPENGPGWYFADRTEPICADMERLATLAITAQPGTRFVYGYATDILGCVVERASGRSLADFLSERILRPLGMKDTWFYVPESAAARLTAVYAVTDSGLVRAPDGPDGQGDYVRGPRVSYSGGAGLVSTARDYARFLQMLLNGGQLDGARILSPTTVRLMTVDHLDSLYSRHSPGTGFGLGFEILEDPGLRGEYGSPGRYAWGGAYATGYWVDPKEDLVAVYMIQLLPSRGLDPFLTFRTLVYSAIVR